MQIHEDFFISHDGAKIRYRKHAPATGAKSWVVLLNGRTEYAEKYEHVPQDLGIDLNTTGLLSWDHRGQGQSSGRRYHINDYHTFVDDAVRLVQTVVSNAPYTVIAHSMGGLIALGALTTGRFRPQQLILSAPLLGTATQIVNPQFDRSLTKLLCFLGLGNVRWPVAFGGEFATNVLTHSEDRYKAVQNSPYGHSGPTLSWIRATLDFICQVEQKLQKEDFGVPIRIMLAEKEGLVSNQAVHQLVKNLAQQKKNHIDVVEISGARHELFYEADPMYQQVIAQTRAWLETTL